MDRASVYNLFEELETIPQTMGKPISQKRSVNYRASDLILNKYDVLSQLEYTDDVIGFPVIDRVEICGLPKQMISFSKCLATTNYNQIVNFYESDVSFARIHHNPKRYIQRLGKFSAVIGPDFSQKIGYPPFVCFENSWWNKAYTAYFQKNGIFAIPNVAWSTPSSFEYAFKGLPKRSVIAINSTGILSNDASKYFWRKGYEMAHRVLDPICILRFGDVMPGEDVSISIYFENINLMNLRNGR